MLLLFCFLANNQNVAGSEIELKQTRSTSDSSHYQQVNDQNKDQTTCCKKQCGTITATQCSKTKICCIGCTALIAVILLVTLLPDNQGDFCHNNPIADSSDLANTEWQVELGLCTPTSDDADFLPHSFSPVYCPANITKQNIKDLIHQINPGQLSEGICINKANATQSGQTCLDFKTNQTTLVTATKKCDCGTWSDYKTNCAHSNARKTTDQSLKGRLQKFRTSTKTVKRAPKNTQPAAQPLFKPEKTPAKLARARWKATQNFRNQKNSRQRK